MLDSFSYMYKEIDIEAYYYMKIWPQQMTASLSEGKQNCEAKREEFNNRLDTDKENFKMQIQEFRDRFGKIKEFKDLSQLDDFAVPSHKLD